MKNTFSKERLLQKIDSLKSKAVTLYSEYLSSNGVYQIGFLSQKEQVDLEILSLQSKLIFAQ